MGTLLEQLRWNVFWDEFRSSKPSLEDPDHEKAIDTKINSMTNVELIAAISQALSEFAPSQEGK